jgi:hypothetical protein
MGIFENLKNVKKFVESNRFSLADVHTLTIELDDKIVFTVNEETPSERKLILEGFKMKIRIEPAGRS